MRQSPPRPRHSLIITRLLLASLTLIGGLDGFGIADDSAKLQLLDLWPDQNFDDINFDLSEDDLEKTLDMVASDSQIDYRDDESGHCGELCHASILTLAGLASYAVYNGLATDNFLNRRSEDISSIEDKIEDAKDAIKNIKDRLDHAWKVSEKNALKRRIMKKQMEVEEDQLILRKRQDFLDLVTQGLQTWRGNSDEEKIARKEDSTGWGRELGLRVRKILDETRRKKQMKRNKDRNGVDIGSDRQDSVAVSWGRLLGKRIRDAWAMAQRKEAMRQQENQRIGQGSTTMLGGVWNVFNPINSIVWWNKKLNESKYKLRRNDEAKSMNSESRFKRRSNYIHVSPRYKTRLQSTLKPEDKSDDWKPREFHENYRNQL